MYIVKLAIMHVYSMIIDNLQGKKHVTNKKTTYISFSLKHTIFRI
jgi:hypothetical protein